VRRNPVHEKNRLGRLTGEKVGPPGGKVSQYKKASFGAIDPELLLGFRRGGSPKVKGRTETTFVKKTPGCITFSGGKVLGGGAGYWDCSPPGMVFVLA